MLIILLTNLLVFYCSKQSLKWLLLPVPIHPPTHSWTVLIFISNYIRTIKLKPLNAGQNQPWFHFCNAFSLRKTIIVLSHSACLPFKSLSFLQMLLYLKTFAFWHFIYFSANFNTFFSSTLYVLSSLQLGILSILLRHCKFFFNSLHQSLFPTSFSQSNLI